MSISSPVVKMLWILVPAITGLVLTTELLSSSACKIGTGGIRCSVILLGILRSCDETVWGFLQVMDNKAWVLFCYKCAAGSGLIVVVFLEVLLDIPLFDLFNGQQLEYFSLVYLTALTFTVLQSMESFSSSRPIDRTGPDDMEILSEER